MVKRLHKTLPEARKELAKVKGTCLTKEYKIFKVKNASVWKYKIATQLEWLHGLA